MPRFRILDWAGNDKSGFYGEFDSFDDAWEALYRQADLLNLTDDERDKWLGEFFVEEAN